MNLFFNTRNVTTKGVYNMKKSKRLEIVSTIVKKHKIYKKEQIISYIEEYFGVRYSATTIAKDLKELNIYRVLLIVRHGFIKLLIIKQNKR